MMFNTLSAPCWMLTCGGKPVEDLDGATPHYGSVEEAAADAQNWGSDRPCAPQQEDEPCVTVTCDGCEEDYIDDSYGASHFASVEDATAAMREDGYQVDADGSVRCAECLSAGQGAA